MTPRSLVLLACLLPAACATVPRATQAAYIPPNELGTNQDSDLAAVNLSSYVFAEASRLQGNPVGTARATASVEYLADTLPTDPRWNEISPEIFRQMSQARGELRHTLGIAPNAPPQLVVNGLLGAADAILTGNREAASQALPSSVFTLGPQETLNRLAAMPFQTAANIATIRMSAALNGTSGRDCYPCG
jgi:hypothetical protein